jgi:hypothetical protein
MNTRGRSAALVGIAAIVAACGGSPPSPPVPGGLAPATAAPAPPPAPVAAVPQAQPTAAEAVKSASEVLAPPAPRYAARGRRDPFQNLELIAKEKERDGTRVGFTVASTKLTGVIQGQRSLLALVETAEGHGYILKPGDTLGDGRVVEIGRDRLVFSVPQRPGSPLTRVVLRLATD